MTLFTQFIGAIVEAWGEVKVAKARVILSLVGVTAAVAALSTVIALGEIVVQSNKEMFEAATGRSVTLHINVSKTGDSSSSSSQATSASPAAGDSAASKSDAQKKEMPDATGLPPDVMGDAMSTVAERFTIPYWSHLETSTLEIKELAQVEQTGNFRGRAPILSEFMQVSRNVTVNAVDPDYATIFRIKPTRGRWIEEGDENLRVVPIVINSTFWNYLGKSPISDPILLHTADGSVTLRVVGVVKSISQWDAASFYVDYTAWRYVKTAAPSHSQGNADPYAGESAGRSEMVVWLGPDQADQGRSVLPKALAAVLGSGWSADAWGGEKWDGGASELSFVRNIVMLIGAIVIFLGALGLLNVAIVTVRQRIREIGIRRAMGASASRVFFSVFMESVVATFVAGLIGVGLAIVIVRFIPLEMMNVFIQDRPAFPVNAAIDGVAISTGIGALCGIIPAFAAVRVKPIDAIRY